ncbi:MAG: Flp pilus assembly complex ATPase component TadA, partial [Elusimicrobia bacterium]|nr:Flp pilus assembly complex ATPase component TadA [Elusimicrobiota bacterium]
STLHTNDAMGAVVRLADLGIEPFLLSNSLALVAAQRLVRLLCPNCRESYRPDPELRDLCLKESQLGNPPQPEGVMFYRAKGCEKCFRTGYLGRRAIYEVYLVNEEMRDIIYRSNDTARLKEAAGKAGMWNLRASGWRKVLAGLTTADEVMSVTLMG